MDFEYVLNITIYIIVMVFGLIMYVLNVSQRS